MSYWVKDPATMKIVDRSLEAPMHLQDGYLTPAERFFVCNSGTTPRIDARDHIVTIRGDGVVSELRLTPDDLRAMPQHTVPAMLECAGNHRFLFEETMGEKLDKRPQVTELMWRFGAAGMAEWRGVPLRHVLERAGISDDAYHVCPAGGESDSREGVIRIPIPVPKAMHPDTILAMEMNGEPLPPDHGFPVRVIVPGWIGAYSVKWVREIEVSRQPIWVTRNTEFYVLMGEEWPAADHAPAKGAPITEQSLKSSLALPWPAALPVGDHEIHGYAWSSGYPIAAVHWSDDAGTTWHEAALTGPNERWGWARFQFPWTATAGEHVLMTRATDTDGQTQPASIPFNVGGYLFNAIHPHPVVVT